MKTKMKVKSAHMLRLPPGSLTAPPGAYMPKTIEVFRYTADSVEEKSLARVADLAACKDKPGVLWVNVDGVGDVEIVREIGNLFGLHPLALEDVLHVRQRPKVDDYGDHLYVVVRMLHFTDEVESEQVSMFLTRSAVITFQEHPGDSFDTVRQRLRKGTGLVQRHGADYLMYALMDAIIDDYYPFLEGIGEQVEALEDQVVARPSRTTLGRVHAVKRNLLDVRRAVWPLRDAVNSLLREDNALIAKATRLYLRDCYDHTVQVLDIVETYRESAGNLMDIYLSSASNRMNEVMKVLTIIATIFIPLTFLAGVYGMNFRYMPELGLSWTYPALWAVMVAIAVTMLVLFWRKGWIGRGRGE
ncbi:MAG: magnesium/cobalt transporter CorA [Verrucomicrobia bacterium]|nr:magnesium/cobalt transporter CorA [Verrucomicrobiota bacterium]